MRKAILIDDEIFARKGLCALIPWRDLGFDIVAEASDGEEGLALIRHHQPDLVITDIRMPVVDGLTLIRSAKEQKLTKTKFIVITGYNDFSYAQKALRFGADDLLLKPVDEEELAAALRRIAGKLDQVARLSADWSEPSRTIRLEQLLLGKTGESEAEAAARELGWPHGAELRYVLLERNDAPREEQQDAMEERERLKFAAAEFLGRLGNASPTFLDHSPYVFGFVADASLLKEFSGSWERFADGLLRAASRAAGEAARLRVYLGAPAGGPSQTAESYRSAGHAVQHKYALPDQAVVLAEQLDPASLQYRDLNPIWTTAFMDCLEEHDLDGADAVIERIFEEFRTGRFAEESLLACLSHCVLNVAGVLRNMEGGEAWVEHLRGLWHWNKRPMTLDGLKRLFADFARSSSDYMAELRREKAKGGIHKVKAYIDAHFHENINLKSIAKTFYMNPVYLGQLFKKTYGSYFNEYLLHVRVQEAKRLLRQTDLKVYEIAERVGFGNADYFVTQFEKVEGKSPTEYKNHLLERT
jgi:two-component system response regulator YesN